METFQAYITLIKDVFTGLAALTAAVVGIVGLQTWKRQIRWKTEYELSQRVLRAVYKVREAMFAFRNPVHSSAENSQAMKEANIQEYPEKDKKQFALLEGYIYDTRWQKVQEALLELEALSLETEVVWDESVKKTIKPLQECAITLLVSINQYLKHNDDVDIEDKTLDIIFELPFRTEDNSFTTEIIEAVKNVEKLLKTHLKL